MNESGFSPKRKLCSLTVNGIIFLATLVIAAMGILYGASGGQVGTDIIGFGYLKPFTMDSNLLSGLAALIIVLYDIRGLRIKSDCTPLWAVALQLMAATSLGVTFVTTACFLAPIRVLGGGSYFALFKHDMFHFHFMNPVLSFVSFIFLQRGFRFQKKTVLLGMVPTMIYSFVYLFMVVILKVWEDFYYFTFGGRYGMIPLVFLAIYSIAFVSALVLIHFHNHGLRDADS